MDFKYILYIVEMTTKKRLIKNPNKNSNKNVNTMFLAKYDMSLLIKDETIFRNQKKKQTAALTKALNQKDTRKAISLIVELHSSGYFLLVFKKLMSYYISNINLVQPRGVLYISDFIGYYKSLPNGTEKYKPVRIINDMVIRNFLIFFATMICGSNQRTLLKLIKITSADFNLTTRKKYLVSRHLNGVKKYIELTDHKEIIIPLNEIITILINKDIKDGEQKIIFWISWLFEYEKRFHGGELSVAKREILGIDEKYHKDFIWIIWDMIKDVSAEYLTRYIVALENIYKYNYTRGSRKKKINLVIFAILLHLNPLPKIQMPVERIHQELFKKMQKEALYVNQRYLQVFKHKYTIDNL